MEKLEKLSSIIKNKEEQIKKLKLHKNKKESSFLKRKKRAHILITVGALIEKAKLLNADKEILLGYLLEFHLLSNEKKKLLKEKGKKEFNN